MTPNAATRPGRSLRGSAVPTLSRYGRPRSTEAGIIEGSGAGSAGTPEWIATTCSRGAPKCSLTSAATLRDGVCTTAPEAIARSMSLG